MVTRKACDGNSQVRFDEEEGTSARSRRRSLFRNIPKVVSIAFFACTSMVWADTWYVDANSGNDDWDGLSDYEHRDVTANPVKGPKKTLSVFATLVKSGDTIYAAPGHYNELTVETNFRFYTSVGNISLIATGSASDTFIEGTNDTTVAVDQYGCGLNAIVPVKMLGGNNVIKGFTIANGRQSAWSPSSPGGGAVFDASTDQMIDCVVTNCVAMRGGGVQHLGYALRCHFTGNYAVEGSHGQFLYNAVNCLFENTFGYAVYNNSDAGVMVNCTFRGNMQGSVRVNSSQTRFYNSIFIKASDTQKAKHGDFYNCLFDYDPIRYGGGEAIVGTNGECRVVTTGSIKINADGTPMEGCPAIDQSIADYYNDKFPAVFDRSEKPYDLLKHARTYGAAMDLGAGERQADTYDDGKWYVDAVNGNDANSGKTPSSAFKTLARASTNDQMEIAADVTIYVAEGTYNAGVVRAALTEVDQTDCRVFVAPRKHFVATGDRSKTIIEGASSMATESGIGPGAVRCCLMRGGTLRGFTLRNGNVNANSAETDGDMGGGLRIAASNAYAIDCEIHHCNAVRGGGVMGGNILRCYVHDNTIDTTGVTPVRSSAAKDVYKSAAYNSVIDGDCYLGGPYVNCTLLGTCHGQYTYYANCYIGTDGSHASTAAIFTNCVCATAFKSASRHDGCVDNTPCKFDANWRPKRHSSAVVNMGDNALYDSKFPVGVADDKALDYSCGPRVLEGRIDIGAGELKWVRKGFMVYVR